MSCTPAIGYINDIPLRIIRPNQLLVQAIYYNGLIGNPTVTGLPSGFYTDTLPHIAGSTTEEGVFNVLFSGVDSVNGCIIEKTWKLIITNDQQYGGTFIPRLNGPSTVSKYGGDPPDYDNQFFSDIMFYENDMPAATQVDYYLNYNHNFFPVICIIDDYIFPTSANVFFSYRAKLGFLSNINIAVALNGGFLHTEDAVDNEYSEIFERDATIDLFLSPSAIVNNRRSKIPSNDTVSIGAGVNIKFDGADRWLRVFGFGVSFFGYKPIFLSIPNPAVTKLYPVVLDIPEFGPSVNNSDGNQTNRVSYINNDSNSTWLRSQAANWEAVAKFQIPDNLLNNKRIDKIRFNITYRLTDNFENSGIVCNARLYRDDHDFACGWSNGIHLNYSPTFQEKTSYFVNTNYHGFNNWFTAEDIADENGEICVAFVCPENAEISSISISLYESNSSVMDMYSSGYSPNFYASQFLCFAHGTEFEFNSINMYSVTNRRIITAFFAYSISYIDSNDTIYCFSTSGLINSGINLYNNAEYENLNNTINLYSRSYDIVTNNIDFYSPGQPSYLVSSNINLISKCEVDNSLFKNIELYTNSDYDENFVIYMYSHNNVDDNDGIIDMYLNCDNFESKSLNMYLKNILITTNYKFDASMFSAYNYNESINFYSGGGND